MIYDMVAVALGYSELILRETFMNNMGQVKNCMNYKAHSTNISHIDDFFVLEAILSILIMRRLKKECAKTA